MRFSTVFVVLTGSSMVFAGAVPQIAVKRSINDIQVACDAFTTEAQVFPFEIGSCFDSTCSSLSIDRLVNSIDNCTTALGTVPDGSQNGNDTTLSNTTANTFNTIMNGLENHEYKCGSRCLVNSAMLDAKVDSSLSAVLQGFFEVFTGLKSLVTPPAAVWIPTLISLGMNKTLAVIS